MDEQQITIAMSEDEPGFPHVSPDRIMLSALVGFTNDVQMFLKGQNRDINPDKVHVAVVEGSFAIATEPLRLPDALQRDLLALFDSQLIDRVDRKRREVIEKWQKLAKIRPGFAFKISVPFLGSPIIIDKDTDYRLDDADRWVAIERYVHGVITEVGGTTNSNLHVRLQNGLPLIVSAKKNILRDDDVNRVYKAATLRVKAQFNVVTHELKDAMLIEFVDYKPEFDEAAFGRMTQRGAQAWKDVPNATQWVDDMRGH